MNKLLKLFTRAALVAVAVLALHSVGVVQQAEASSYSVALTTYVPTASATDYGLGAYPNIANSLYVRQIAIANNSATAQDITIYDVCTSSISANTVKAVISLPATIGTYYFPSNLITPTGMRLTNPCFARSATTGTTRFTIFYE